jgi:hypothetical protein
MKGRLAEWPIACGKSPGQSPDAKPGIKPAMAKAVSKYRRKRRLREKNMSGIGIKYLAPIESEEISRCVMVSNQISLEEFKRRYPDDFHAYMKLRPDLSPDGQFATYEGAHRHLREEFERDYSTSATRSIDDANEAMYGPEIDPRLINAKWDFEKLNADRSQVSDLSLENYALWKGTDVRATGPTPEEMLAALEDFKERALKGRI